MDLNERAVEKYVAWVENLDDGMAREGGQMGIDTM